MKGNTMNIGNTIFLPLVLVLVCAGIAYATVSGKTLPLIATPRAALIALLVIGMASCANGIGQVAASGRWVSLMAIVGYLLGAVILVVIVSAFAGWKLPLIDGEIQSVAAVGLLIVVKFVISTISTLFHWL